MPNEKYYKKFLRDNLYPRQLKQHDSIDETPPINFSSNDYLGLATHPLLIARSQEYAERFGVGATSSRLVAGNFPLFERLEETLAKAIGKPAALILGSGYQTNITILEALLDAKILGKKALVFSDRYCHISMLATTRHLCKLYRFRHNDLTHLWELLEKNADNESPKFILVESIYSMEGDQANLADIIQLAKKYRAMVYVDDAHAVGVYGASGWGKASEYSDDIDIVMGTFSKALGSFGGYIACSELMRDYFINKCRGLIYSTGLSPAILGAISGAIDILPQLGAARQRLEKNAALFRQFMRQHALDCGKAETHIIPWIIGDVDKTLLASQLLEKQGILGAAIRPPSVPLGKSRIRFCLSAMHTDSDIAKLQDAILKVQKQLF